MSTEYLKEDLKETVLMQWPPQMLAIRATNILTLRDWRTAIAMQRALYRVWQDARAKRRKDRR